MRECLKPSLSLCLCVRPEAAANSVFLTIVVRTPAGERQRKLPMI